MINQTAVAIDDVQRNNHRECDSLTKKKRTTTDKHKTKMNTFQSEINWQGRARNFFCFFALQCRFDSRVLACFVRSHVRSDNENFGLERADEETPRQSLHGPDGDCWRRRCGRVDALDVCRWWHFHVSRPFWRYERHARSLQRDFRARSGAAPRAVALRWADVLLLMYAYCHLSLIVCVWLARRMFFFFFLFVSVCVSCGAARFGTNSVCDVLKD